MGKKVNGVTLLKCRGCGKELSGKRKAFCSRICSTIERKEKERIRYRIYNPQLEKEIASTAIRNTNPPVRTKDAVAVNAAVSMVFFFKRKIIKKGSRKNTGKKSSSQPSQT